MSNKKNILVINCGSSSLKYDLFCFENKKDNKSIAKGLIEKIGEKNQSIIQHSSAGVKIRESCVAPDHASAFSSIFNMLCNKEYGILDDISNIHAVGHRVVHGGENYAESVIIDASVKQIIKEMIPLAPLHNPAHLIGIDTISEILPSIPQIAVFDTAFHQTMPEHSYLYALPYGIYKKYKIRRYGFHGTSHYYVSRHVATLLNKDIQDLNMITCHLGNGASITAIEKGKSIDTSMGFTPLEGLMMGTRCGSVDPAIINYLITQGKGTEQINAIINKKSGLLGISGISNDMRDIEKVAHQDYHGDENTLKHRANLALTMYAQTAAKYIGGFMTELQGVDVIVFTAGVGQYGTEMRERICNHFTFMGLELDKEKNKITKTEESLISTENSKIKIAMIPTNEELQIAQDTYALITN